MRGTPGSSIKQNRGHFWPFLEASPVSPAISFCRHFYGLTRAAEGRGTFPAAFGRVSVAVRPQL